MPVRLVMPRPWASSSTGVEARSQVRSAVELIPSAERTAPSRIASSKPTRAWAGKSAHDSVASITSLAPTSIDNEAVVVWPSPLVTWTVNADDPTAVGVPSMVPLDAPSASPAGSDPLEIVHVNEPFPPAALSD